MDKGLYNKNFNKLDKATYPVGKFPGFRHEYVWPLFQDAMLVFAKYFNNEYTLKGKESRIIDQFDQLAVNKYVKMKDIYSPWKIIDKGRAHTIQKNNPGKRARFWQYKSKFFPLDQESLHIIANHGIAEEHMFQGKVVKLSHLTSNELGGYLGRKREKNLFNFLGVPTADGEKDPDIKDTDKSGKKLTPHTLDLFRGSPDEDSEDLGFKDPETAQKSIQKLADDPIAHKVRASLLMIQRAKGALKNVKDKEKKSNLKKSLAKWMKYKNKIIEK